MTEQEAFNNPEMKTILLLSGYIRELSEGADYKTTTHKLAKTIVKVFSISQVEQRRELLKAFIRWNNQHNGIASPVPERMADRYLESLD